MVSELHSGHPQGRHSQNKTAGVKCRKDEERRRRRRREPGERLKEVDVEEVVPPAVHQEVESVNGDEVREGILTVDAAQRRHLHRRPHPRPPQQPTQLTRAEAGEDPRRRKQSGRARGLEIRGP